MDGPIICINKQQMPQQNKNVFHVDFRYQQSRTEVLDQDLRAPARYFF